MNNDLLMRLCRITELISERYRRQTILEFEEKDMTKNIMELKMLFEVENDILKEIDKLSDDEKIEMIEYIADRKETNLKDDLFEDVIRQYRSNNPYMRLIINIALLVKNGTFAYTFDLDVNGKRVNCGVSYNVIKHMMQEVLIAFLVVVSKEIKSDECIKHREKLIKLKNAVYFLNKDIESLVLGSDFDIMSIKVFGIEYSHHFSKNGIREYYSIKNMIIESLLSQKYEESILNYYKNNKTEFDRLLNTMIIRSMQVNLNTSDLGELNEYTYDVIEGLIKNPASREVGLKIKKLTTSILKNYSSDVNDYSELIIKE